MTINLAYLYQLISYTDIQISQNLISAAHQIQFSIRTNQTMKVENCCEGCVPRLTHAPNDRWSRNLWSFCASLYQSFSHNQLYSNELCVRHCHRFSPIYARVCCAVLCLCVHVRVSISNNQKQFLPIIQSLTNTMIRKMKKLKQNKFSYSLMNASRLNTMYFMCIDGTKCWDNV